MDDAGTNAPRSVTTLASIWLIGSVAFGVAAGLSIIAYAWVAESLEPYMMYDRIGYWCWHLLGALFVVYYLPAAYFARAHLAVRAVTIAVSLGFSWWVWLMVMLGGTIMTPLVSSGV